MQSIAETSARSVLAAECWSEQETIALRTETDCWSYATLAALTEQRRQRLTALGLQPGQVVLCATEPTLDSRLMQQAVTRMGAALLPIQPNLARAAQESLAQRCGAEWLWQSAVCAGQDGQLLPIQSSAGGGTVGQDRDQPAEGVPALLVQTSGSSRKPKVAMLGASAIHASCVAVNQRLSLGAGDLWLCCLPQQHVGGLAIGYRCALAGVAMRVLGRFDTRTFNHALMSEPVTHVSLVPAMLNRLLEHGVRPGPRLRVVLIGGQSLNPALARRAIDAGWPLYLGYGMTETFSQVAGAWVDGAGRPSGGLKPLEGVEFRTRLRGRPRPLQLRGPMLMLGYATPRRLPGVGLDDGWLTTGDLALFHPEGRLEVLGRADDVLLVAGLNVQPALVEERLATLEGIGEIAVVGLPEAAWGHRLVAIYTGPLAPAALETWCRAELASHLRPRSFLRCQRLPLRPSGKCDRAALTDWAATQVTAGPG